MKRTELRKKLFTTCDKLYISFSLIIMVTIMIVGYSIFIVEHLEKNTIFNRATHEIKLYQKLRPEALSKSEIIKETKKQNNDTNTKKEVYQAQSNSNQTHNKVDEIRKIIRERENNLIQASNEILIGLNIEPILPIKFESRNYDRVYKKKAMNPEIRVLDVLISQGATVDPCFESDGYLKKSKNKERYAECEYEVRDFDKGQIGLGIFKYLFSLITAFFVLYLLRKWVIWLFNNNTSIISDAEDQA